jgi:hypothetical protein
MPRSPHDSHDEPRSHDAVARSQLRYGEPRPAQLLEEACTKPYGQTKQEKDSLVARGEYSWQELTGEKREDKSHDQRLKSVGQAVSTRR